MGRQPDVADPLTISMKRTIRIAGSCLPSVRERLSLQRSGKLRVVDDELVFAAKKLTRLTHRHGHG